MTRYPKSGKGKKWTVKELQAITNGWAGDILSDGEGLRGEVRGIDQVAINFKYQYQFEGRMAWHYCGTFPATDMAAIREERDKARDLVKRGLDPKVEKVVAKIEAQTAQSSIIRADELKRTEALTFGDLFAAWIKDGVARGDGNAYLIRSFEKYTKPTIGNIEVRNLTEHHLRELYRSVIALGKIPTAHKLTTDIGQALRWAEKRKPWRSLLIDGNPSELVDVSTITPKEYDPIRTRQLSIEEICKLKQIFETTALNYAAAECKYDIERPLKLETQIAIWICLGTICRIGELLMTRWEHVDFENRKWSIPKENTKGKEYEHVVFLSDFTLKQFQQLHDLTGKSNYAFPARNTDIHVCLKSVSKQVGDRQSKFKLRTKKLKHRVGSNSLVIGSKEWTPHDLRRTGATMMQELTISREIINLCLNHSIGSKIDRSYLLHLYENERREAWHKLGDRLEAILSSSNVVTLKST